jgi:hypothetical protein
MPNRPAHPNDPPNPPDVTVESVLGAQVGNPPILSDDDADPKQGEVEPPEGALTNEIVPDPEVPPAAG